MAEWSGAVGVVEERLGGAVGCGRCGGSQSVRFRGKPKFSEKV